MYARIHLRKRDLHFMNILWKRRNTFKTCDPANSVQCRFSYVNFTLCGRAQTKNLPESQLGRNLGHSHTRKYKINANGEDKSNAVIPCYIVVPYYIVLRKPVGQPRETRFTLGLINNFSWIGRSKDTAILSVIFLIYSFASNAEISRDDLNEKSSEFSGRETAEMR